MKEEWSITLVGAGRVATALGPALSAAGSRIDEVLSRDRAPSLRRAQRLAKQVGARAATLEASRLSADVVWLCVSDGSIASCACALADRGNWEGKIAFHCSGALSSDELAPLRSRGARVASLHPMMTFVQRGRPSFDGVSFAFEGDCGASRAARLLVEKLGGRMFRLAKEAKPLYHALGAYGSPLLVMNLAMAEQVARAAGIGPARARKILEPMVRRTLDNYFAGGLASALSGPLVRGDLETVRSHLRQLAGVPGAREVYVALARAALLTLPVARKEEVRRLLETSTRKR